MSSLFLSPSTQQENSYISGGTEQFWMNRLADVMEPYLHAAGINVTRNNPDGSVLTSIRQSNLGHYDFHLALHSNAGAGEAAGVTRYSAAYYFPGSAAGLRMANILVDNLKKLYPLPDRVFAQENASLAELRQTRAPAVLLELAFHDNEEDAAWIKDNLEPIAENLSLSVTEYFGLPAIAPSAPQSGTVTLNSGTLNLRSAPLLDAPILRSIPDGANVEVLGVFGDWYSVSYLETYGWAAAQYIAL